MSNLKHADEIYIFLKHVLVFRTLNLFSCLRLQCTIPHAAIVGSLALCRYDSAYSRVQEKTGSSFDVVADPCSSLLLLLGDVMTA